MEENKVEEAQVIDPIVEAKKLLEEDKTTRMQQALAEINDILKKYNCDLSAVTQLNAK